MKPRKTLNSAPTAPKKPFITLGNPGQDLLRLAFECIIPAAIVLFIYASYIGLFDSPARSHSSQPDPNSYTASEQRISQKQELDKAARQSAAE